MIQIECQSDVCAGIHCTHTCKMGGFVQYLINQFPFYSDVSAFKASWSLVGDEVKGEGSCWRFDQRKHKQAYLFGPALETTEKDTIQQKWGQMGPLWVEG